MSLNSLAQSQKTNQCTAVDLVDSYEDRRKKHRVRTVYRLVRIEAHGDQGLARVRNVSDDGMKLTLYMPVTVGDTVRVALSEEFEIDGTVVWKDGSDCGLRFDESIDSSGLLRDTAQQSRSSTWRSLRLQAGVPAMASSDRGLQPIDVRDVSLGGLKIAHDNSFVPGLPVKVYFSSGIERRGVVRWATDKLAGVMLIEPFAVEELGAVSTL